MTTAEIKRELVQRDQHASAPRLMDALAVAEPRLRKMVPAGTMEYEFAKAALGQALRDNPALGECDPHSTLAAWAYTLQLGLPLGPLGLAYLIPYKREAVCVIGYLGKIELAYRSGLVQAIDASLVYEGDVFEENGGTAAASQRIVHKKQPRGGREIVAAYAIGWLKGSSRPIPRVIYEEDWEKSRKASPLGRTNRGLWADDFPSAVLKTAYHRLAKQLPKTAAMILAETVDEQPAEPIDLVADEEA